jgi:hypothetical protein
MLPQNAGLTQPHINSPNSTAIYHATHNAYYHSLPSPGITDTLCDPFGILLRRRSAL